MATPPVFTTGQVLTAAQMSAIGLWHITTVSPTPATVVQVDSVFTTDFTNYRVIVSPLAIASSSDVSIRLRTVSAASTVSYYMANTFVDGTGITATAENNIATWRGLNLQATGGGSLNFLVFELYGPFAATQTRYQSNGSGYTGSTIRNRLAVGFHDVSSSFTGFELVAGFNITATISIYGYNDQ